MGPVLEGAGLNITVLSYSGSVDVGFIASPNLVPDLWMLADAVAPALAELAAAATRDLTPRQSSVEPPGGTCSTYAHGVQHGRPVRAHGRRDPRSRGADLRRRHPHLRRARGSAATSWPTTWPATGIEPGDHVGIYAANSIEWIEALLAIFKIRAVPININYRYVEAELRYLFDNADLKGARLPRGVRAPGGRGHRRGARSCTTW